MDLVIGVALAVLILLAARSLQLLRRLKKTSLEDGTLFSDRGERMTMRYPPWWQLVEKDDRFIFMSHEKDGVLELTFIDQDGRSCKEIADEWTAENVVTWDDPMLEDMGLEEVEATRIESRATLGEGERKYLQLWVIRLDDAVALFVYKSSVMFGLVDSWYLHQMLKTIQPANQSNEH